MRPLGSEPGAERWFAAGGAVVIVGLGVSALLIESVGCLIASLGLLLVAYTGVLIALDHRGAARAFARRAWTEVGISVPASLLQMRVIGGGMAFIGLAGTLIAVAQALSVA